MQLVLKVIYLHTVNEKLVKKSIIKKIENLDIDL